MLQLGIGLGRLAATEGINEAVLSGLTFAWHHELALLSQWIVILLVSVSVSVSVRCVSVRARSSSRSSSSSRRRRRS